MAFHRNVPQTRAASCRAATRTWRRRVIWFSPSDYACEYYKTDDHRFVWTAMSLVGVSNKGLHLRFWIGRPDVDAARMLAEGTSG